MDNNSNIIMIMIIIIIISIIIVILCIEKKTNKLYAFMLLFGFRASAHSARCLFARFEGRRDRESRPCRQERLAEWLASRGSAVVLGWSK